MNTTQPLSLNVKKENIDFETRSVNFLDTTLYIDTSAVDIYSQLCSQNRENSVNTYCQRHHTQFIFLRICPIL